MNTQTQIEKENQILKLLRIVNDDIENKTSWITNLKFSDNKNVIGDKILGNSLINPDSNDLLRHNINVRTKVKNPLYNAMNSVDEVIAAYAIQASDEKTKKGVKSEKGKTFTERRKIEYNKTKKTPHQVGKDNLVSEDTSTIVNQGDVVTKETKIKLEPKK